MDMGVVSKLTDMTDTLRARLPARPDRISDLRSPSVPAGTPDTDDLPINEQTRNKLKRGMVVLSLTGVVLTTVGLVARYVLDRGDRDETEREPFSEGSSNESASGEPAKADPDADGDAETDTEDTDMDVDGDVEMDADMDRNRNLDLPGRTESREYPRVAPLVGMVALMAMRLIIKLLSRRRTKREDFSVR